MKKNETGSVLQVLAVPVLIGLVSTLVMMAICSVIILLGKMSSTQVSNLSLVCIGLGSIITAFMASRLAKQQKLLWGLASGLCLFICMVLISLAWLGQAVDFVRVIVNLAVSVITAVLGSLLGASMKHKRYKPNHKK